MNSSLVNRRHFLAGTSAALGGLSALSSPAHAEATSKSKIISPPVGKTILISTKLGMITKEENGRKLTLTERLKLAGQAGFDGVDLDEAGSITEDEARAAVQESGVFVHNAINHDHWGTRLTDPKPEVRAKAVSNLEHTIRVAHAAGGSGVLLVIGKAADGPAEEIEERCRQEIKKCIPLAASLGQRILFENVWNQMMYDHDRPPEQSPERFIKFVDSFNSPWVGMYYDLGNHWKYGQPGEWLKAFGPRAVKLDLKGFNRPQSKFVDITGEGDDMPYESIRKALSDLNWTGWTTAEVGGGGLKRLTTVREQMQKAFGL